MKIRPAGAELSHADGRTDRRTDVTTVIIEFRNFAKKHLRGFTSSGIFRRVEQ